MITDALVARAADAGALLLLLLLTLVVPASLSAGLERVALVIGSWTVASSVDGHGGALATLEPMGFAALYPSYVHDRWDWGRHSPVIRLRFADGVPIHLIRVEFSS